MHLRQAEAPRHPGGDLAAGPQPAVLGRPSHPLGEGGQQRRGQEAGGPAVPAPAVAQRVRAERVVARRQSLHPARREGQHLGRFEEGPAPRQQPDRLEVPRLRRVARRPVPRLQLLHRKMPDDPRHGRAPEPWPVGLPAPAHPRNPARPIQSAGPRITPHGVVRPKAARPLSGVAAGKAAKRRQATPSSSQPWEDIRADFCTA